MSSFAVSCFIVFPTVSIVSAIIAFSPMVAAACGSPRSASFCPMTKRLLQRQTTPPHSDDPSGSIRQSVLVVAGPCASSQHCHASRRVHGGARPIHHEQAMSRQHRGWQRRGIRTGRCNDALCTTWRRTTRRAGSPSHGLFSTIASQHGRTETRCRIDDVNADIASFRAVKPTTKTKRSATISIARRPRKRVRSIRLQ